MRKLLIAGPAQVFNIREASRLKAFVMLYLSEFMKEDRARAIVCASDTLAGQYAMTFAHSCVMPVLDYAAELSGSKKQITGLLSQEDRDALAIRDAKMLAEPDIARAILFNHTGECTNIIAAIQSRDACLAPIPITRVVI